MLSELNERRALHPGNTASIPVSTPPVAEIKAPGGSVSAPAGAAVSVTSKSSLSFEAGKAFALYDRGDGKIDKQSFENILLQNPDLISKPTLPNVPPQQEWIAAYDGPSRSLTHFDETAGVAIPLSAVAAHQAMGNSVVPLLESYSSRYSRLRTLMTAKLLPKREQLVQFRRQLNNTSAEVEAAKASIERETISDTQQILDRLKTVESLRQSAIKHQVIPYLSHILSPYLMCFIDHST